MEDLRRDVAHLSTRPDAATLLFADLAKNWLKFAGATIKPSSRRRRETAIGQLKPYFQRPARNIGRADVERWSTARAKLTSARTYNIERETLIQILDYAKSNGLLLDNPARILKRRKEPKAKPIIPTREQFGKLVVTIRRWMRGPKTRRILLSV